ncbi:MAG: GNAT family N-acetyltransferase [Chitinophagales bacterium]
MRIITLHGIRRSDKWYRKFSKLESIISKGINVLNFEYGYFTLGSFISPWMRKRVINEFITFYNEEIYDDEIPSVICHSFGTYVLYKSLLQQKTIVIDKLILCGSILKEDIDWQILFDRRQISEIYHDIGHNDRIVKLSSFIPDCGNSGKKGFTVQKELLKKITQETNHFGHSDYFTEKHMTKVWTKFLLKHLPTFKFNRELLSDDIINRIYKCNTDPAFSISKAKFNARIDKGRNYYGYYIYEGVVKEDNTEFYHFKTSADSTEEAEKLNFIAFNKNGKLHSEVEDDIRQYKSFKIYFDDKKNKEDFFYLQTRFQWLKTMSFNDDGDTDHWQINGIKNIEVALTFPYKLKLPSFVIFKNRAPIQEQSANFTKEKDGTFTYHWTFNNSEIKADALLFFYEGIIKTRSDDDVKIVAKQTFKNDEYTMLYCQDKQIDYVYDLERKIENDLAAHKTILKQRKDTFNNGFLIVVDKDDNVVSYLESIIWNQPHFEKFEEIKCFPLLHDIHGDVLYIIFLATDPINRKIGIGNWMLDEISKIALKFDTKKVTLVAKSKLVDWYEKKGFVKVKELPNFLPNKAHKSIQMEKKL